jgi:hypothetical protein
VKYKSFVHGDTVYILAKDGYYKSDKSNWEKIEEFTPTISVKKPPVGLKPQWVWYQDRIIEIEQAIDRYKEAGEHIPIEWTLELLELTKILV